MGCAPSTQDGRPIKVDRPGPAPGQPGAPSNDRHRNQLQNGNSPLTGDGDASTNGPTAALNDGKTAEKRNVKENLGNKDSSFTSVNSHGSRSTPLQTNKLPLPAPKSIAFEVKLDGNGNNEAVENRQIPTRLKTKLAPLENAPKLTADMLENRLRQVEMNREKELEKKKEVSRRSSRLRRNILQAKEFEKAQEQYREIEEKQQSAGKNREARLAEIEQKKKMREERAKRARERARRLKQEGEDDIDFEVEKDDGYDDDDADSWLGDDDQMMLDHHADLGERIFSGTERVFSSSSGGTVRVTSGTERVYSGRESPSKRPNQQRSSAEQRARMSAGTSDSFDFAFQRQPPLTAAAANSTTMPATDDFFDT